jgi:hypothetical protein
LTPEEIEMWGHAGYVKFEDYPVGSPDNPDGKRLGRFWTQEQLDNHGCGTMTRMGLELAETYARQPKFYGATYCCGCNMHKAVEEFVWEGTSERVGS